MGSLSSVGVREKSECRQRGEPPRWFYLSKAIYKIRSFFKKEVWHLSFLPTPPFIIEPLGVKQIHRINFKKHTI